MDKYNWFQRNLHALALSKKFIKEASFDIEKLLFMENHYPDNHIFITGLARSGTTSILNAIYQTGDYGSLTYSDMPFILSPNIWSKLYISKKSDTNFFERSHKDGIKISKLSPEAFEEVFWNTFDDRGKDEFRHYVNLILKRCKKTKYLSKNNQNIKRIDTIRNLYPNSKILIPFREPIQQANSLLKQHKKFMNIHKSNKFVSKYMSYIGHSEFGPNYKMLSSKNLKYVDDLFINHWLEQWYIVYCDLLNRFSNTKNIYFVCYEMLTKPDLNFEKLGNSINIKKMYQFNFINSNINIDYSYDKNLYERCKNIYEKLKNTI